jgi:hypothetical protein
LQPHGGAWGPDGTIVFSPHQLSPLLRIPADGGDPLPVTKLTQGQLGHSFPQFLPDGLHVLYFAAGTSDIRGDYVGRLDGDAPSRRLLDALSPAAYVPGYVLFVRENALFAQALDPIRFDLKGNAAYRRWRSGELGDWRH